MVRFAKDARKLEMMRPYLARQAATGRSGIAAIGWAQEFQWVATCTVTEARDGGCAALRLGPGRAAGHLLLLLSCGTTEFGPAFVKIGSYFPYPIKVWLNGHEWAKQQATKAGIGLDRAGQRFRRQRRPGRVAGRSVIGSARPRSRRSSTGGWPRLPLPLTAADRAIGYWWELSMRQIEVSRTMVFDQPRNGRAFFEALVADNLDLGRPEQVELIFGRRILPSTTGVFATRVVTRGVDVTVNVGYKHSRIKEYFKEGRALRIETVVNDPTDLGVLRRLVHLDELSAQGP